MDTGHAPNAPVPVSDGIDYSEKIQTNEIRRLMEVMGNKLAPKELRDNERIKEFIDGLDFVGTIHQVMVARLYALALYKGDIQAMKLIVELLDNKNIKVDNKFIINFISPISEAVNNEKTIELTNDSWGT